MTAPTRRAASLVLALAVLLAVTFSPRPAAAQTGAPLLDSNPAALEATLALGQTATITLDLHNNSPTAITPSLFEALPPTGLLANTRPRADPIDRPRIDPVIAQTQAADPRGEAELIVLLDDQADLAAAYAISNWAERGRYVYTTLRSHAEASQRDLRALLDSRGLAYTPLWIVNAVAVRGTAPDVAAIAAERSVRALWASKLATLEAPPAVVPAQALPTACASGADNACWNIARVGASRVWADFGVAGEGITVASIDSGVRFEHPALIAQYRGSGSDGVSHDYNWFDAYGGQEAPVDSGNHGTHTMGTMVARGLSASEPAVGVAPGARWIAARACSTRNCTEVDLIRAAQWILAPTDQAGGNPRPELRPHVVNNSWAGGQNASWYMGYVAAWRAAGIYPVFAAGNSGSLIACSTIESPGDYAQVTAVGATDSADQLASFSGIGPSLDGRLKPDLVAPGQSVYSTVADPRGYGTSSGTSMATPHVAGAVALLWSANPSLIGDYEATYAILTGAATPLSGDSRYLDDNHAACRPDASPNNIYGYGRLEIYRAVATATVDVPWLSLPEGPLASIAPAGSASLGLTFDARMVPEPGVYKARVLVHGPDLSHPPTVVPVTMQVIADTAYATVTGQVRRAVDATPLQATVQVVGGATVATDAEGRYSLTLPPAAEPYTLTASARHYLAAEQSVQLAAGAQARVDFELAADEPRLEADTIPRSVTLAYGERATLQIPISNRGTQPLIYTASTAEEHYGVWRSDELDGPAHTWIEPPAGAISVPLSDDGVAAPIQIGFSFPYYYGSYTEFTLMANGVIALGALPPDKLGYGRSCLPLPETVGAAIVPLRVNLDPSAPGARVSYANLPEGLLVSWENVPLSADSGQRLSFQALLIPDGRISLRYKSIAAIPPGESPSAGLQYNLAEVQSLGCRTDLPIADGLTVELRPQAPATLWLSLASPEGSVSPSAQASVQVTVGWISARPFDRRFSGVVELRSNDPAAPLTRFTLRLQTLDAPYSTLLTQVYVR